LAVLTSAVGERVQEVADGKCVGGGADMPAGGFGIDLG